MNSIIVKWLVGLGLIVYSFIAGIIYLLKTPVFVFERWSQRQKNDELKNEMHIRKYPE